MNLLKERVKSAEQQEIEALADQLTQLKQLLKGRVESERLLEEKERQYEQERRQLLDQIQSLQHSLNEAEARYQQQTKEAALQHQDTLECVQKLLDSAANDKEERRLLLDKISALDQELSTHTQKAELAAEDLQGALAISEDLKQALHRREEEMTQAQALNQECQQRLEDLERQLQEQTEEKKKALQAKEEAEQSLRQLGEQTLQRNQKIEALSAQLSALEAERLKGDEQFTRTKKILEEREAEIKIAQQHLAKKVKETTRLTELHEEVERRADRLQQELNNQRSALDALKTEVSRLQRREKQLHDQLTDQAQMAEAKLNKWEEDHLKVAAQLKAADAQIRKLDQLIQKHAQLRALFEETDRLIKEPLGKPHDLSPGGREDSDSLPKTNALVPDLFSLPKPPMRVRQNLFEP